MKSDVTSLDLQSLYTGELATEWTPANDIPISRKEVGYRQWITVMFLSHVLHSSYCNTLLLLLSHLEDHEMLTDLQHDFRSGSSCETQLPFMTSLKFTTKSRQLYIAVLNFSKAFDTVPHDVLLSKLKHYGIEDIIWQWVSYVP